MLPRSNASCRSLSAVPVPLELFFRLSFVTSRPSVESSQRSRAHPCHPGRKLHTRNPPRIANCRRQNRPSRHHFFAPVGLSSHPLSWRQNFSRTGATPIEPGRNFLVSALARLGGAKRPSAMLWNGDSGLASNPGNHWPDLEATLIYRSVRRISVGLQVGPSEEAGRSLRLEWSVQTHKPSPWL